MKNIFSFFVALVFLSACNHNIDDLSKFDLNEKEKRSWDYFQSEMVNLGFKYPSDEMEAKDSDDVKNAIHIYDNTHKDGSNKFNMIIKPFDGGEGRLKDVGDDLVQGTSFKFNYARAHSGIINYGRTKAYQHEYTTSTFYGVETRHYQLIFPLEGERILVNFSADSRHFFPSKKKMHKILRSIVVK